MEAKHPSLSSNGIGSGSDLRPFYKLLGKSAINKNWTADHQGALRSVVANRQWLQLRCYQAGLSDSKECQLCGWDAGLIREIRDENSENAATNDLNCRGIPLGTLMHRNLNCSRHAAPRSNLAPEVMVARALEAEANGTGEDIALDRGILQALAHLVPPPVAAASFRWDVELADGI